MNGNDRLTYAALIVAIILCLVLIISGCSAFDILRGNREGLVENSDKLGAVEVSRVPIVREELPLPEAPESFAVVASPATTDTAQELATKLELAELAAKLERLKAETATAIYKQAQAARQEIADAQKTKDIEMAALEERLKSENTAANAAKMESVYSANKWLGAIIAAAIACVLYAYKRMNAVAATLGLLGFAGLFCLVLGGQYYPQYLPFAPLVVCPLIVYIAHRAGVLRSALVACVRGVEVADDDFTKQCIRMNDGAKNIEVVRKEIDATTVQVAKGKKRAAKRVDSSSEKSDK